MKKIFFELLMKWTNTKFTQPKNVIKMRYYRRNEEHEPIYTMENLKDVPPAIRYIAL